MHRYTVRKINFFINSAKIRGDLIDPKVLTSKDDEGFSEFDHFLEHVGQGNYLYSRIFTPFIGGSEKQNSTVFDSCNDNFVKNINGLMFYRRYREEGDTDSNYAFCGLWITGHFFYLNAWHDYTGFDCQGGMKLYVDTSLERLATFAMNREDRQLLYDSDYYKKRKICYDKLSSSSGLIEDLISIIVNYC